MSNKGVLATVDLGSNSFRLQICKVDGEQIQVLDSLKEMVRLGAGLNEEKILSKSAQERAFVCLSKFSERLRGFEPEQVRVVATNTFRVAKNAEEFTKKAQKALGFPIEIIAGREEARLIYLGVAHTLPKTGDRRLVVDIGGGSTEFIVGEDLNAMVTESLPLGCVSYSMRYFPNGKITHKGFQAAVLAARNEIQRIAPLLKQYGWKLAVGSSGSARALRDVVVATHTDSTDISLPLLTEIAQKIIEAESVKKARLAGMKSERMEVFAGGLAVMMAIFEELDITQMSVVDVALREGVLYDLIGRKLSQDMRDVTVHHFEKQYSVDIEQAKRVLQVVQKLLAVLNIKESDFEEDDLKHIQWAARLHEVGLTIAHTAYHKHSAYITANADMPGFSRQEQQWIALLILGHRGDLKKMGSQVKSRRMWMSVLILRLAALFCRGRKEIRLPEHLQLVQTPKKTTLYVDESWLHQNPLTASALAQEQMQWRKLKKVFSVKGVH
ncbi:exopolyphosphatase [Neisseria sp. Ec49-e6-T10]